MPGHHGAGEPQDLGLQTYWLDPGGTLRDDLEAMAKPKGMRSKESKQNSTTPVFSELSAGQLREKKEKTKSSQEKTPKMKSSIAVGLRARMADWPGRIKCIFLCISLLWGGVLSYSVFTIAGTSALNDDTGKLRMLTQRTLWQVATNRTIDLRHTRSDTRLQLRLLAGEVDFLHELDSYFDVLHHPDEWSFQQMEDAADSVVSALNTRNSGRTRDSWALFATAISLCVVVTVSQTALLILLVSSTKKEQLRNIKEQISQHRKAKLATNITRNHGGRTPPLLESSRSHLTLGHNLSSHTTPPPPPTGPLLLELATGVRPSAEAEMRKTRVNPVESV